MALFLLKAGSPSWDISSLNQLWDLIDCADFLVGLCAPKKWSPSFNALWIKQGRPVHSSLTRLHDASTFVANKRLTRKEWSDRRINLLEASPQVSHHFSCRMSSWIVTQKAKLSVREAVFFTLPLSLFYSMFRETRAWKGSGVERAISCVWESSVSVFVQMTPSIFRLRGDCEVFMVGWKIEYKQVFWFRRYRDLVQWCFLDHIFLNMRLTDMDQLIDWNYKEICYWLSCRRQ